MKMSFEGGRMRKEKSLEEQFDRGRGELGGGEGKKGNETESGGGQGSGKEKNQYATAKGQKNGQEKKIERVKMRGEKMKIE